MKIISYNREKLSPSTFATDSRKIYPFNKEKDSFSSAMVAVKPGKTSFSHMHHDAEIFVIMKGRGSVISESKSKEVYEGDIIYFHPNTSHAIKNHSQQEELLYFTTWWQNPSLYLKKDANYVSEQ